MRFEWNEDKRLVNYTNMVLIFGMRKKYLPAEPLRLKIRVMSIAKRASLR